MYGITAQQMQEYWGEARCRDMQALLDDIAIVNRDNAQLLEQMKLMSTLQA